MQLEACSNPLTARRLEDYGQKGAVHLYVWGRGDFGQLGNGSDTNAWLPTGLEQLEGKNVVLSCSSVFHSAFLTGDGELLTSGNNDSGQLGCRGRQGALEPTRVDALGTHRIVAAACGQAHTAAVTDQGALASWGSAELGQLGQGVEGVEVPQPKILRNTRGLHFARVATGVSHTLALTRSGQVHSCGGGTFGVLGQGDEDNRPSLVPLRLLWAVGVVQVACGDSHSCALGSRGELYSWGRGKYGQLGHGSFQNLAAPAPVAALRGVVGVYVAAGGDHTLLVGGSGEVYSWGHGGWGQTGRGCADHTCLPGRIQALEGERVVQVAAGRRHSLALAASNRVYVWGQGEEGQLGGGPSPLPQMSPRVVQGLPHLPVLYISAGGDCCFVAVQELPAGAGGAPVPVGPHPCRPHGAALAPLRLPQLKEMAVALAAAPAPVAGSEGQGGDRQRAVVAVVQAVESVFTSPGFLTSMFALPPGLPEPAPPHGLDLQAATDTYGALLRSYSPEVVTALGAACSRALEALEGSMRPTRQGPEELWLQALLLLMLNPLHTDPSKGAPLLSRVASIVHHLPASCQQTLVAWFAALPAEVLGGCILRPLQRALAYSVEVGGALARNRSEVLRTAQLLQLLQQGNLQGGEKLSFQEFYNNALSAHANLRDEYMMWRQVLPLRGASAANLLSLCQVPFLLNPEAKSRIFKGEMLMAKQEEVQQSALGAMFQGLHPAMAAYLELHIRRDHILEDALHQLSHRPPNDLKKPLRVKFISNEVVEEGLDEGGVSREFFQLLVAEVFREEYGMFSYSQETRSFWFNGASLESRTEFLLVGILLGLALYNAVILDIHFPQVVYKKLLGQTPTFADLCDLSPQLGRGLQQLLDFQGDVEATFCRSFEVEYEYFGELRTVELIPGGSQVAVTGANRGRYVEAYTRWMLQDSIAEQFSAFRDGFQHVCGGPALGLLRHEELELLLCGLPHLDFQQLQANARYDGGFTAEHQTIVHFWQVLQSLTLEQKKAFLSFTTGCDRAPVGGLGSLVLTIQRSGPDSDRLPTAHTCFNVLLLPEYSSRAKLRDRLLLAIENAQGFGLQ